ncbi:MAG: hypothetical protein WB555_26180 [Candidatus Korobacteraceae bacterium]
MRISKSPLLYLVCAALAGLLISVPANAQGFGTTKKKIVLHRKLPPTAHITGNSFEVQVSSHGIQEDIGVDLKSMLETELMKDDVRLRVEDKNPDTLITCTVTEYAQPKPTTSTQQTYALGSKKPQNETVTRYTGLLTVAYSAKDRRSGRTLDSYNVTAKFDDEFNANGSTKGGVTGTLSSTFNRIKHGKSEADTPPTDAELRNKLLHDVVSQIASRLVNTDESVEVLLARGKLDDANKQAEAGLWSRNLETLETMTPFPDKADDAYRLYNIGVAYEALAYASEDPKAAKKDLENAAINYGKAIDDKPDEKYFLTPQTRIETAIAHYKTLSEQPTQTASASTGSSSSTSSGSTTTASKSSKSSTSHTTHSGTTTASSSTSSASSAKSSTAKPAAKGPALTNDQVIALVKANLDEENIIDTIRNAPNVDFDLSVNGEINLANHGVKGKILTAMKQRARQGSTHKASAQ